MTEQNRADHSAGLRQVFTRVDADVYALLEAEAARDRRSVASMARVLIEHGLAGGAEAPAAGGGPVSRPSRRPARPDPKGK